MAVQQRKATSEELREMARYFHALRDVLRLRILVALAGNREMTVTELARALHVSQPLVSFHLRPLRLLGLVQVRRAGRAAAAATCRPTRAAMSDSGRSTVKCRPQLLQRMRLPVT